MRTIAVVNQKGGSAKTTTAVNLAAALVEQGKRVLIIDMDAQGSATSWLGGEDGGGALLETLAEGGNLADLAMKTSIEGVDLVPGGARLAGADKALAGQPGAEMALRELLDGLPKKRWDVVLVDCPPALGLLSLSSLIGCREALIPVETRVLALSGLARLLQTITLVRKRYHPGPALTGILPCRVDGRTRLSKDVVDTLRARFDGHVFETIVRENVRLAEAPSTNQPITTFAPHSAGAEDYRAAAVELLGRKASRRAVA